MVVYAADGDKEPQVPAETHVEGTPMGRDEVLGIIRERLADILEIEPSAIGEGASFADDLNADSLALIELVEALEEELGERSVGFRFDDDDLDDLRSVRDAVDYVVSHLGSRIRSSTTRPASSPMRAPSPRRSMPSVPPSGTGSPIPNS